MKVLGIVGGIGAGKSSVVSLLSSLKKCYVIGADEIGHRILLKDDLAYTKVLEAFGNEILNEEGQIERKKLGAIVFSDETKLAQLNNITHPIIYDEVQRKLTELRESPKWDYVIVDAALLIEIGLIDLVEHVVGVFTEEEIRKVRLMKRNGLSETEAMSRINNQKKWQELEKVCHYVIFNNYTIESTKEQIVEMLDKIEEGI